MNLVPSPHPSPAQDAGEGGSSRAVLGRLAALRGQPACAAQPISGAISATATLPCGVSTGTLCFLY